MTGIKRDINKLEQSLKQAGVEKFFIDTRNIPCSSTATGSNSFSLDM